MPRKPYTYEQAVEAFWAKVDASGDCWLWTGIISHGYGITRQFGGAKVAHRMAWRLLVGEVEDGLDLDHLCRVRSCVNPDHLEPVTRQENVNRGAMVKKQACDNGHPYTPENTKYYMRKSGPYKGREYRYCRECNRLKAANRKKLLKA